MSLDLPLGTVKQLAAAVTELDGRLDTLEADLAALGDRPPPPDLPEDVAAKLGWLRRAIQDPQVNTRLVFQGFLDVLDALADQEKGR